MRTDCFWFDFPSEFRPGRAISDPELDPGQSRVVADLQGPGVILHLWASAFPVDLRNVILEIFWDNDETPSVECPLADFFGIGHGLTSSPFSSALLYNAPDRGYNSYFPMPFGARALIRLRNDGDTRSPEMRMDVDYRTFTEPVTPMRFHTQWRRVNPALRRAEPLSLIEATGDGFVAGIVYHVRKRDPDDRWTHGGGDLVFLDGDGEPNLIYSAGGENFPGNAWGLYPSSGPVSGAHYVHPVPGIMEEWPCWQQHEDGRYSFYRWFVHDAIPFKRSVRFAFNTMANEISATGYWYQTLPHRPLIPPPPPEARTFKSKCPGEDSPPPLSTGDEIPVTVLGPFRDDAPGEWTVPAKIDLAETPPTNLGRPYGEHLETPETVYWQRTGTHTRFLDLQAVYRPKTTMELRGFSNGKSLPVHASVFALMRVRVDKARKAFLKVGFLDRLDVILNGRKVASLDRSFPAVWDTETVEVALDAGVNDVVLRTTKDRSIQYSVWVLWMSFVDSHGGPDAGVTFEGFPDLRAGPERWRDEWPFERAHVADY